MREVPKAIVQRLELVQSRLDPERNQATEHVNEALQEARIYLDSWVRPVLDEVVDWSRGEVSAADLASRDRHPYS